MVGIHFCGGRVQDIALFTAADGCAMAKTIPACHRHETKPCCDDQAIVHAGDSFKVSTSDVSLSPATLMDVEAPHVLLSEIIPSVQPAKTQFYNYDPPLRETDLNVSLQVFLI